MKNESRPKHESSLCHFSSVHLSSLSSLFAMFSHCPVDSCYNFIDTACKQPRLYFAYVNGVPLRCCSEECRDRHHEQLPLDALTPSGVVGRYLKAQIDTLYGAVSTARPEPTEADVEQANQAWNEAKTWDDAIELNRAFIRGETRATLYHAGPLAADSVLLQDDLLRMHDYGLLTDNGQGPVDDEFHNARDCYQYHKQQRPYCDFLVQQQEGLDEFLTRLMRHPELVCSFLDHRTGNVCSNQVANGGRHCVTRIKIGERFIMHMFEWTPTTHQPPPYSREREGLNFGNVLTTDRLCPAVANAQPVEVRVAYRGEFGVPFALEKIIIELAEQCGIKKQ